MKFFFAQICLCSIFIMISNIVFANAISFSYENAEITKVIHDFAKSSEKTFIVDPVVRGKISIFTAKKVELSEAYELLSSALAVNGYAISIQGSSYVVRNARNIQRDLIEVVNQLPSLKPERMVTYIVTLKNTTAQDVLRELRILPSRDGEISQGINANQLILVDWVSNLHRMDRVLKELDVPGIPTQKPGPGKTSSNLEEFNPAKNILTSKTSFSKLPSKTTPTSKIPKLPLEASDFQPAN